MRINACLGASGSRWARFVATCALLGGAFAAGPAHALPSLHYGGGPTKNFVIDIIFQGPFTASDQRQVLDYVKKLSDFTNNGDASVQGLEAAVHYYGVSGVMPGEYVVMPDAITGSEVAYGGCCDLTDAVIGRMVDRAHNGEFGPSKSIDGLHFEGTPGLPAGPNRLAIVMLKGSNVLAVSAGGNPIGHPELALGFHYMSGGYPFAAVMFDPGGPGTNNFGPVFSHEVFEAMTDQPFNGWQTNEGTFNLYHKEVADHCGAGSLEPSISAITVNASFGGANNTPATSCLDVEPEQTTPMAATVEGDLMVLYYRRPDGHYARMTWDANQSVVGPWDIGVPSDAIGSPAHDTVARGKPSAVYSAYAGGLMFTKGSDNALYMFSARSWVWTYLGGHLFGDPSAVVWGYSGELTNVFALADDDTIETFKIIAVDPTGWTALPASYGRFSTSPKVFARTAIALDVFGVTENATLKWMSYSTATGWDAAVDMGTMRGAPQHTPVSITAAGPDRLDIMATAENGVANNAWAGGHWWGFDDRAPQLGSSPSGTPAYVSWGPGRLDTFMIDRQNRLMHAYYDGAWHADPLNPLRSDATGEPVVLARYADRLDIFYRTTHGSMTHVTWDGSGWGVQDYLTPDWSIQ